MRHARRATDICAIVPLKKREGQVEGKKKAHKQSKRSRKSHTMSTPRGSKPQQQAPRTELDYEIERLKAEIQQERQMKYVSFESSTFNISYTCFGL